MRLIRSIAALLFLGLLASACSSAEPDVAPTGAAEPAPFDAVLIELFGTTDTDSYLTSIERTAAEIVVACMQDAGFEFQIPPVTPALDPPDPTSLEAAQADGFGIISSFRYQLSQVDLDAQRDPDPNVTYVSSLTSTEFDRFYFTLDGVEAEPGQIQSGGCNGEASDEAYDDWKRFLEAIPNFTTMAEERDTHPDWLAARSIWRSCMLDRGFDYAGPDAIRTDVISRMRDTVNDVYPGGQVPLTQVGGVTVVDPTVDALLDELVQFERAAAMANIECTEPAANEFDEVERLVQQAFLDRNQAAINELLEASK